MKTLLIPTDFSKPSLNAVEYGVEFAKLTYSKIVLFHVYQIPVITSDTPIIVPSVEEIEKHCKEKLEKIADKIHKKHGNSLKVEHKCVSGFVVDEINNCAKDINADLIIMGMHGAGFISEKIIGSSTTALMRKANCPVLSIDSHVKFEPIKEIVLACDYSEMSYKHILEQLNDFAKVFEAHIDVLNITDEAEKSETITKAVQGLKLELALNKSEHSYNHLVSEDVTDAISGFITKQKADLLVMIPHQHSFLTTLFKEPNTKKMAFTVRIPLLALHNNTNNNNLKKYNYENGNK